MDKRAQVVIFVIISIFLIVAVISLFYLSGTGPKGGEVIPQPQLLAIKESIQQCVESTAIDAIRLLGLQGGYIIPPSNALRTNFSMISYCYHNGQKVLPSIARIQKDLDLYVELALPLCFDRSDFPDLTIITRDVNAKSRINQDSISITANYPISVSKDSAVYRTQSRYSAEIPIKFGSIYSVISEIISNENSNLESIDLAYLMDLDYDISILPYNDNILVYSVTDPNSIIKNVPYTFMCANKLK